MASDAMRGRVMGIRILAIWGLPLGLLAAGPIIERERISLGIKQLDGDPFAVAAVRKFFLELFELIDGGFFVGLAAGLPREVHVEHPAVVKAGRRPGAFGLLAIDCLKLFDARAPGGRVFDGFGVFAQRSGAAFGLEKSIAQTGSLDAITQRAEAENEKEKGNKGAWHYQMRPEVIYLQWQLLRCSG